MNNAYSAVPLATVALLSPVPSAGATADELFDDQVVHEIRLTTHPSDWQRLRQNFQSDVYYPAILEWRGLAVENIGIRSRGNGSRSGAKPGLKLDFNHFQPGQEFLGLKSIVLDNLTQDPSMMAERLSMLLFRKMGLPAPRVAHARVVVNGLYAGLYTIVEPVDKVFLKRNLGEDGGHLYDYEWASEYWFQYLGDNPASYTSTPFELQTNERDPNPRALVDMIRAINSSSDAEFAGAVSSYLDLKLFLNYLATEMFIADIDGVLGEWGMNNFYLYRLQGKNVSLFLPWDKDVTLSQPYRSVWHNAGRNVLTRRLFAVPELREHYRQALEQCIEVAGGPGGWLEQEVEKVYQQVKLAALEDPARPYSYSDFEESVDSLRHFAFLRAGAVLNQVTDSRDSEGRPVEPPVENAEPDSGENLF
jgi:spore coat protein CotH